MNEGSVDLLARCKAGDELAWRELVAQRVSQIYRWALLLGLPTREAEDAAQEVLLVASRRIETCKHEKAVTSWLYQITRRVAANHRRAGWFKRWVFGAPLDEQAFHHETPAGGDYELDVRRCLQELGPKRAEILVMVEVVGFTRHECAAILGIPPGTVAGRLQRAREAFAAEYRRLTGEDEHETRRHCGTP